MELKYCFVIVYSLCFTTCELNILDSWAAGLTQLLHQEEIL